MARYTITAPVLLAFGDHDFSYGCAAPGTAACTPSSIRSLEKPFHLKPNLNVMIIPDSGHDIQLHKNAPRTDAAILEWVTCAVRSN